MRRLLSSTTSTTPRSSHRVGTKRHAFRDRLTIHCSGGPGGRGGVSFEGLTRGKRRADGGDGGDGGDVVLIADGRVGTLGGFRRLHFKGEPGNGGRNRKRNGKNGRRVEVRVPCGVVVERTEIRPRHDCSYEEWLDMGEDPDDYYEERTRPVADLDRHGAAVVVARGGLGGTGNAAFVGQYGRHPNVHAMVQRASKPQSEAEEFRVSMELKSIADVGLLGFPNAGKSSLLSRLSKAKPAVASYPFTTVSPTVGNVCYGDGGKLRMADIPGIIEGASGGRGKGLHFLRHVERTNVLMYVLDSFGEAEGRGPVRDLEVLVSEIEGYAGGALMGRTAMVTCNKLDLFETEEERAEAVGEVREAAGRLGLLPEGEEVWGMSAKEGSGMADVAMQVRRMVEKERGRPLIKERDFL